MYQLSKVFVNEILKEQKYELLGKLMKRYEVVYNQTTLTDIQRKNMLRDLLKELIHENYRDLKTKFSCYSKGIEHFKIELQRPSSK